MLNWDESSMSLFYIKMKKWTWMRPHAIACGELLFERSLFICEKRKMADMEIALDAAFYIVQNRGAVGEAGSFSYQVADTPHALSLLVYIPYELLACQAFSQLFPLTRTRAIYKVSQTQTEASEHTLRTLYIRWKRCHSRRPQLQDGPASGRVTVI